VMTVDVDGWSSLLRFYGVEHDASMADAQVNVEAGVSRLLDLFANHGISTTFFVTGDMASRHPHMVKTIGKKGHEVACHGLYHWKDEFLLTRTEQKRRIEKATSIIQEIIGARPLGFRAPCLKANRDTFNVLSESGYLYDSSVIPTFIPGYYGYLNSNFKPYWLPLNSHGEKKPEFFLEMPVSVNPLLFIPLSASWMRNLGSLWVKFGIRANFILGNPVVFYIHPRDVLTLPRVEGVPSHVYRNVGAKSIEMLDCVLGYAKSLDGVFLRAIDLAGLLNEERM
jgi:hypothetical protein